jgi:quercetin dioxygenase-like cupin family protein
MFVRSKATAPRRARGGLVSHVFLEKGDGSGSNLAVTWVDVEPRGRQDPHRHDPEQAYVIVRGSGTMRVGDEERTVREGDVVFVPPGVVHGITNDADAPLSYVSASTPTFGITALYDALEGSRATGG